MTLGGNDLKKKIPASVVFSNLKQIVTIIQQNGSLVIIGGIDIPFYNKDYADDYVIFAKENGCLLVPNVQGYKVVAESFYETIKDYL